MFNLIAGAAFLSSTTLLYVKLDFINKKALKYCSIAFYLQCQFSKVPNNTVYFAKDSSYSIPNSFLKTFNYCI
jgi:hypothetical protein